MDGLFADAVSQSYGHLQWDVDMENSEAADQCTSKVQASLCIDLDEDAEIVIPDSDDVTPSHAPQKQRAVLSKRSAPVDEPVRAEAKRKCIPENVLNLNPIKISSWEALACVFVKKCGGLVAVALWSQYRATWRDVNDVQLGAMRWIIVGPYEFWVSTLIGSIATKCRQTRRNVAKTMVDIFRQEFHASLAAARTVIRHDDTLDTDECLLEESPFERRPSSSRAAPVLHIELGQFKLTTLNSKRRMALRVDAATVQFVSGWLLPLLRQIAEGKVLTPVVAPSQDSPDESTPVVASSQDSPDESHDFHLTKCLTPNIRNKVCWCPAAETWKVYIENPTKVPCPTSFSVRPGMDGCAYRAEKVKQYWLAVDDWNKYDTSKRHRIPKRFLCSGLAH